MSDSIDVKMTGVDELVRSIKELAVGSPTAIANGVKRVAFMVERDAKGACAVDTGRLRASISTNWTGSGLARGAVESKAKPEDGVGQPQEKSDAFTAVIGTNTEYAPFVEWGHKQGSTMVAAQPYLYPAFFKNEGKVKGEISKELGKELAKAMRK